MTTTKTKDKKSKKADKPKAKPAAQDLGTATGVAEARTRKGPRAVKADDAPDLGDIFDETKEQDALELKLGEAAKEVKSCHLHAMECATRLRAARMSTSTPGAIRHDLERVVELSGDIGAKAQEALRLIDR